MASESSLPGKSIGKQVGWAVASVEERGWDLVRGSWLRKFEAQSSSSGQSTINANRYASLNGVEYNDAALMTVAEQDADRGESLNFKVHKNGLMTNALRFNLGIAAS
ncbi:hypothetical protein K2173_011447 [Erythroxylum novogranatense]|uniref:Uncharacterized protein n=1 Tax=Erythroxylum novogranatense TaxID=1862640 RepID=A0AAV8TE80_9ROSI|nr:hypothetical protein K2173_011447 [Erythroxylum novogranatense]